MLDFIVDFYCHELGLAIEVDGCSHNDNYDYDDQRQHELQQYGISFIRFDDLEVKKDMPSVLRTLEGWILDKKG
ncbi:uncharacterized protein DUF559 [Pontibacter ummariensis]|uniref:DUF559 domain-containing protein n=2 Tax=Pontibacter ummariensis TaxID=1610492 RepID=A0A239HXW3_9BACT|nr:uncharacterized protein DUF559 [Pontibacter ummariensis]SNS86276.1 Protein of unknown function [Pontibacter ummariensis]